MGSRAKRGWVAVAVLGAAGLAGLALRGERVGAPALEPDLARPAAGAGSIGPTPTSKELPEARLALASDCVVRGTVRRADGGPASFARVFLDAGEPGDARPPVVVAPDGSFELRALPPGAHTLRAIELGRGRATGQLTLVGGQAARWDAVLSDGRVLTGRVVDEADAPLPGWTVRGRREPFERPFAEARSGADGGFRLERCPEKTFLVELVQDERDRVPSLREEVQASEDELLLRVGRAALPHGSIAGQVLDEQGEALSGAILLVPQGDRTRFPFELDADGRFLIDRLPAGLHQLVVEPARAPRLALDPVELRPAERVELGAIRLEAPGTLILAVEGYEPSERGAWDFLELRRELGGRAGEPRTGPGDRYSPGQRRFRLRPGRYELLAGGGNRIGAETRAFEIESGVETRVELAPRPGRHCLIGVSIPAGAPRPHEVLLRLLDADGRVVLEMPVGAASDGRMLAGTALAAGRYTLEARAADGRSARGEFALGPFPPEPGGRPPELVLPLE